MQEKENLTGSSTYRLTSAGAMTGHGRCCTNHAFHGPNFCRPSVLHNYSFYLSVGVRVLSLFKKNFFSSLICARDLHQLFYGRRSPFSFSRRSNICLKRNPFILPSHTPCRKLVFDVSTAHWIHFRSFIITTPVIISTSTPTHHSHFHPP